MIAICVHCLTAANDIYLRHGFWVTTCKMVCPMLLDHCPICLSCLSATLVYYGQIVRWIKMKLGMEVGLGPGHIVLDGDPAPPQRGTASQFLAHVCCGQTVGWIKIVSRHFGKC